LGTRGSGLGPAGLRNGLSLRKAAVSLGLVGAEDLDRLVDPLSMLGPEE
jgi:hypothetical protein